MKIAISSKGETLESTLDKRFGRCKYFLIKDTDTNEVEVIKNEGVKSESGAAITATQQIIDRKVDVVITGNLGPNAFHLIDKADIKAYKSDEIVIQDALDRFNDGKLPEIKKAGPASHGGF
ncbi:MAG: diguanylate cyclase [Clostridiales bacterium]|nr:diguanylate cyclase [Clostridiales bacterium]